MRPLKSHLRADALTTLETVLRQTKKARVCRRAQAVREVVAGHHVHAVSALLHCTHAALRQGGPRCAQQGPQGLRDRPRPGRPRPVTCALEQYLNRLVDQAPLQRGARASPWSCRALATVLTQHTGVQLGHDSVRGIFKNKR
jgi:transposase